MSKKSHDARSFWPIHFMVNDYHNKCLERPANIYKLQPSVLINLLVCKNTV